MSEIFQVLPLRFWFRAAEPVVFPPGQPANIIRGAFGIIFRRLVCVPPCRDPKTCDRRPSCPYARIFAPRAGRKGPSGFADPARPFVFRAHHLDARTVAPGEMFHFDLHLFDVGDGVLAHFVESFRQLARRGLGPTRGRAVLTRVESLGHGGEPREQVYTHSAGLLGDRATPLLLSLSPEPEPVHAALVRFLTPTELKRGGGLAEAPEFGILFARIRDRLSSLRALYGQGPLAIDFKGMGERAEKVRLVRSELRSAPVMRRSARTGEVHPIGGFTGEAEYEGELAEFMPYLRAAYWTGAGRQTVWGKGMIEAEAMARRGEEP
jgi:hypothetical protein